METQRTRALRQAHLYGCLISRTGRLYYPRRQSPCLQRADGGRDGESRVAGATWWKVRDHAWGIARAWAQPI